MKKKFRKYDVEVGKDFQFESLDGVIQETDKILASYVYAVNGKLWCWFLSTDFIFFNRVKCYVHFKHMKWKIWDIPSPQLPFLKKYSIIYTGNTK